MPDTFEFYFGAAFFILFGLFYGPRSSDLRGGAILAQPIAVFLMALMVWGPVFTLLWLGGLPFGHTFRLRPLGEAFLWFIGLAAVSFWLSFAFSQLLPKRS